jgi:hypothetical protein
MADPAARAHAVRGAAEFRTADGEHRLYFDFSAKKKLFGLAAYGAQELSPEKTSELRSLYHSDKLPDFPEKAFHNGKSISPDKAFKILCSNPYYDMNRKKLIDLPQDTQTRADFLKQRSLDMGGKEYANEDKGLHRIYFQSATAVKNLYGLETKGKAELSAEQHSEAQKKFPYNKFLPNMPESATLRGEPVEPQRAFDLLASQPYFDVNTGRFETFSNEKTFDKFISDEFAKKGVTEERRTELFDMATKHDKHIAVSVKEAATFAAQSRMEVPLKDMTPAQQMKAFLTSAVEKNKVPWEQKLDASAAVTPLNCVTGNEFARSNLVAASLHMAHINSNDPRYLTENEIQKNNLMVDDNAVPLKIAYRVQAKDGSYQSKVTTYFNAKDVAGIPELKLPESINKLSPPITPERAASANDRIAGNMTAYIAALSSNRGFQPATSGIAKEDYKSFSSLPMKDLFQKINEAASKAAELSQAPKENQIERGKQAAGMEM